LLLTVLVEGFRPENYGSVNGFPYLIRDCGVSMGTPVGGLLLPAKGPTSGLVPRDYTKVIIYFCFACAVGFGLIRIFDGAEQWKA